MSDKIYQIVTDQIIQKLQEGTIPWQKPWTAIFPQNLATGHKYRGINLLLLSMLPYSSSYWMTFKQVQQKGGKITKGEKSSIVTYWSSFNKTQKDENGEEKEVNIPFMRYYKVWNLEQIEGIEAPSENQIEFEPIDEAERVIENMPNCPSFQHGGDQACYIPMFDMVRMPPKNKFQSEEHYYSTLFHELAHSTGHKSRLNRKGITGLGDGDTSNAKINYSFEELVAEIAALFLCGRIGINNVVIEQNAAYVNNWLKALQNDHKMVVKAASKAQKAAEFILGEYDDQSDNEAEAQMSAAQ